MGLFFIAVPIHPTTSGLFEAMVDYVVYSLCVLILLDMCKLLLDISQSENISKYT